MIHIHSNLSIYIKPQSDSLQTHYYCSRLTEMYQHQITEVPIFKLCYSVITRLNYLNIFVHLNINMKWFEDENLNLAYKTDSSGPWFWLVEPLQTFVYFVCCSATTLFQSQLLLRNYIVWWKNTVFINIIILIYSILFCETSLNIWNNCFIKAIIPVKPWFTVNL